MLRLRVLCVALLALAVTPQTRDRQDRSAATLMQAAPVKAALAFAKATENQTIEDQVRFSEIAAPPFNESARGEELKRTFERLGLQNVRVDKAGNVLGHRQGAARRPHVVIAAHLDTVFPAETDVRVKREGAVLRGAGISDNSRGLAVLVAIVRALRSAGVRTPGSLTFVGTVGEEGLGDLRGVKQLFNDTLKGSVDSFVTIDGTGLGVAHTFVGSRRYRVTFRGPGGHSFSAFGLPSPVGALGRAVTKISEFQAPSDSMTTFNVGRIGGGTAVNAIPFESWMEVDLRSLSAGALQALDARFQKTIDSAVAEENARWKAPGMITATKEPSGNRPAGAIPQDAPIVQAAMDVTRALGANPVSTVSSSDANYPTSIGIPSVEIAGGGSGRNAHSPIEAFDTTGSWLGTQRALLLTIALAQK